MTAVLGEPTTVEPQNTCEQCGQTDDHPKIHYGWLGKIWCWHHDCAPARVKAEIIAGVHGQHPLVFAKIR